MDKPDVAEVLNADHLEELEAEVLENPFLTIAEAMAELPGLTLADAVTALRRIAYHNQCKAELSAEADALVAPLLAKIDQIRAWQTEQAADIDRRISIHESRLQAYYRLHPPIKGKTLSLPGGKISERSQQSEWDYGDEKALIQLLQENRVPLVRTKFELDKANLKKVVFFQDGEWIVPNTDGDAITLPITVTEKPPVITVTVGEGR